MGPSGIPWISCFSVKPHAVLMTQLLSHISICVWCCCGPLSLLSFFRALSVVVGHCRFHQLLSALIAYPSSHLSPHTSWQCLHCPVNTMTNPLSWLNWWAGILSWPLWDNLLEEETHHLISPVTTVLFLHPTYRSCRQAQAHLSLMTIHFLTCSLPFSLTSLHTQSFNWDWQTCSL